MLVVTPEDLSKVTPSKYMACVVAAKYARKLHDQKRETTQFIEEKVTTESLRRLCANDLNFEIVSRRMSKKKPKSLFPEAAS
ncbi:DNA-directed RNA polymerase subunit omega [bacterium]|nr:DNA-directed RNA polymerase subunit omega [bacterium]